MKTEGWWLTWPLWWELLWGRDPDLWVQDLHRTLWEILVSLGSFLFLFPEKRNRQFGCSLNKEHSLLFCCEIYDGKKWPNPRKEDSKQTNKNVSWRPCHSSRLHLPAEPCGFGAPYCPLPACVCVSRSLGSVSPVSGVLCIPCSARDRHPQPWWAGRVTAKWACNSGMRAQSCRTASETSMIKSMTVQKIKGRDGPVIKTPCLNAGGLGFDPWSGNEISYITTGRAK